MEHLGLLSIFVVALSMSLSHCVGMCGGIVIAYSNGKIHQDCSAFYQAFCHILYSLGRITSYIIIGGISASIGYGVSVSMGAKGFLFIIVGILLILFAFFYMFFPKMISYIEPSGLMHSKNKLSEYFQISFAWLMTSKNLGSFYGLGILNGLLPCGMVYWFALNAAMAPNVLMGMITMGVFGFATLIPMFVLGFISGRLITTSFRSFFMKLSFVLMICFGSYSVYKGILIFQGKMTHSMHHHQENLEPMHMDHSKHFKGDQ